MTPDSNRPETLLAVSSEIEAAAIVAALADCDIKALSTGGYTSGFKAEAPGLVAVVVKQADFERAKQSLVELRQQQANIDWSKVDVMETGDEQASGAGEAALPVPVRYFWWLVELVGIVICLVMWLWTGELTPALVYIIAGLAVMGLFLALSSFASRRY